MGSLPIAVVALLLGVTLAIEHNLPEGVELVDPKDLGLDSQIDLDKLLGNVKALPIDGNALSSALGKTGLKTQVLTVGFDGSEGINLDDFELPQLKNDEHAPLAQAAFSSFKNFFKTNSSGGPVSSGGPEETRLEVTTHRPGRKRLMKRRKVLKVNGTAATSTPAPVAPSPKVIELDSSQIEKLIASGKIGPPKSLTPGGPQIIELGQKDLDALLSGENGDEIKQILEGGDAVKDFDLSQLQSGAATGSGARVTESAASGPVSTQQEPTSTLPVAQETAASTPPPPQAVHTFPTTQAAAPELPVATQTPAPTLVLQDDTTGLPIIYQYSSAQDQIGTPAPPVQSPVPLQFYSSSANGQQQTKLVKHPTFELISAPPVSFSSSVLSSAGNNQVIPVQFAPQAPQASLFLQPQQPQQQFRNTFISPQPSAQFIPIGTPSNGPPAKGDATLNKILPAKQQSSHTEQVKPSSAPQASNFIENMHKVNLPANSVKLVTPSPQVVHSLLNQVPASFQPSLAPNHIVSSPVVDPLRVNSGQSSFLSGSSSLSSGNQEPFRNTQLFSPGRPPVRSSSSIFRFPSTPAASVGGPNRFRTAESQNPYFSFAGGNLVLNSFVAGDGLNYRPTSSNEFRAPGI